MFIYCLSQRKIIIKTKKGEFQVSPSFINPETLLNVLFNCVTKEDKKNIVFGYHREKELEGKFERLLKSTA